MAIETTCSGCGRRLRVQAEHLGKQARCPICGTIYTVVATGAAADPVADPGEASPTSSESGSSESGSSEAGSSESGSQHSPALQPGGARVSGVAGGPDQWSMRVPEGQVYGPVSRSELDRWLSEGRIATDCALRQGAGPWQPASDVYPMLPRGRGEQPTVGDRQAAAAPQAAVPQGAALSRQPGVPNPYADPGPGGPSYGLPQRPTGPDAHRGGLILVLGIAAFFCCPIFGIFAWILGHQDIRAMRNGRMDPEGMGMTQVGMIFGIISCVTSLAGIALTFLSILLSAIVG